MLPHWRLTLADARHVIAGARAEAQPTGVPMCIAVVDGAGNLLAFAGMDGAKFTGISIAIDKAFTAAGTRRSTRDCARLAAPGEVAGAIGCSSGTADEDEQCAQAGIARWQAQLRA